MKVEELIIDGFKSYATRTVISDWDPQFNAITGLNGSGKSNILDAICFVLGITSMATVRAANLQDLIYKRGQAGVTKASVTIVFDNSDKDNCPIGFTSSAKISLTRQIIMGGTSKYLINGHRAPQQSVLQLLQSVQLNINNPNFLIMQGKITKVLNMKPSEILSLIEEAAGTKMFEDRREKAERTMAKKETKLQENRVLLKEEIEPKLEKLRSERKLFHEYQSTQADLENISKVMIAYDYHEMVTKQKNTETTLKHSEHKINQLNEVIDKLSSEITSLYDDINNLKSQKAKEMQKDAKLTQLEDRESQLSKELSKLETSINIWGENFNEANQKRERLKESIARNTNILVEKREIYNSSKQNYEMASKQLQNRKETQKKKEELLSTLTTGVSSTGIAGGYDEQLHNARQSHNDLDVELKKIKMKIEYNEKELKRNESKKIEAEVELEKLNDSMNSLESVCFDLEKQLKSYGYDPSKLALLKKKHASLENELYNQSNELETLRRKVSFVEFNYMTPYPGFDSNSVKGVAANLFTLSKENTDKAIALQVCAGGRLFNVVVDNEKTASYLLEKGKLKRRVTIIPLNKIAARRLHEKQLQLAKQIAPGKVDLALNLVGYDHEVAKAMEFIFGSSLICANEDVAKAVTFNPNIRSRSITLEGDVYDPEGTLSGGSRKNNSTVLLDIQKYNTLKHKVNDVESQLRKVKQEMEEQIKLSMQTQSIQKDLSLAKHKLQLANDNLKSNPATQTLSNVQSLKSQIEDLKHEEGHKMAQLGKLKKEIQDIEMDIKDFSNDKGSKLSQLKSEIDNLNKDIENEQMIADVLYEAYQNLQLETEQLASEIKNDESALQFTETTLKELNTEKAVLDARMSESNSVYQESQLELNEEKRRITGLDEELRELEAIVQDKAKLKRDNELEMQKIKIDFERYTGSTNGIQEKLQAMLAEHGWLKDEPLIRGIIKQNENIDLQSSKKLCRSLQEKFDGLKNKVNPNILNMIENVEKKESALKAMISTIEDDKTKIQETITKLNEYKKEALVKTWKKVTEDFGQIFGDLLPNSSAKLVPLEGKDLTHGLEVKVKLGNIWKESLIELSGGQRSLIALSLIMALLQFRPAPMYILDEVDAALDLSHTQNIGHLIKTRFKGAQFIVVSLKEGMFSNANKVFRTRFQDGTSVVTVL